MDQSGREVRGDKVWQPRGAAEREGGAGFPVKLQEKPELIYVLQVDMGLIAMVTGHVPQHLPSSPPPLPSHSHHSSKRDDTGFSRPLQLPSVN